LSTYSNHKLNEKYLNPNYYCNWYESEIVPKSNVHSNVGKFAGFVPKILAPEKFS
jgi:hypothetical protein